jgi:hypothetical protein
MKDHIAGALLLAALLWATVFYVLSVGRILLTGFRTGRLRGRGRYYDRATQPVRFWLLSSVWTLMGVLFIVCTIMFAWGTYNAWTRP